ncbi:hypothetical protein UYSO10_4759 [Kosakonia radicincitans]|nr:hypothetical protein UYSO10_4759 [Kosakonia radicincitans]
MPRANVVSVRQNLYNTAPQDEQMLAWGASFQPSTGHNV